VHLDRSRPSTRLRWIEICSSCHIDVRELEKPFKSTTFVPGCGIFRNDRDFSE